MLSVIMPNVIWLSVVALAAWVSDIFYNLYFVKKIKFAKNTTITEAGKK
jgi:hypothetical protein